MVVGVDYTAPSMITPDGWHQSLSTDLHSGSSSLERWWTRFDDPTLNRLIDVARESNRELAIAYERVDEARAARGVARSGLFPNVNASGLAERQRISENIGTPAPPAGKTEDFFSTGLDANWEIDFFGGVRRSIEAADATVEGAEELYRDTLVSLLAEVAIAYVQLRTAEERIAVAQRNITNQQSSVELTQARLDAGLSPELDVSQAETNLATTRATIPTLRNDRALALNRLATLIGRFPAAADTIVGSGGIPSPPSGSGLGLPADLIRSRPDLRAAERELAAQTARIGVAEADLYPRFALSGNLSLQSLAFGDLFENASKAYGFGPNFQWNVFNGGRIRSAIDIEESRTQQAFLNYQQAVLLAVEEVENNLATVRNERERLSELNKAVTASRKTEELVTTNYTEGLIDFQNVLDAQRTTFANEDAAAASRGVIAAAYAALFKSLGGGTPMKPGKVDPAGKP